MLTLVGGQVECLWDAVLPIEVRALPDDLARLDRVLADEMLLWPIAQAWEEGARERGQPSIAMVDGGQAAHRVGVRDARHNRRRGRGDHGASDYGDRGWHYVENRCASH
jgi:hypothetical protein